uniref:Uncharacterized protein n=1 Tax=Mycena chlorophos TaxID=658473 RepID=A0ABQ0LDJ2_MYCCL|nr:predicted protein [Mycena chlorophos]
MHTFTATALKLPRPYLVQWMDDQNKNVLLNGHQISIEQYFSGIRERAQQLQNLVEKQVLFGIDVGNVETVLEQLLLKAADSSRIPILLVDSDRKGNPQSRTFLVQLKQQGHLFDATTGLFDPTKTKPWLDLVLHTMQDLHSLVHVTQGLPGRGTEDHALNLSDILYNPDEQAIGIAPQVRKTEDSKSIFRQLSRLVSRLLFIMLRIIRPVELLAVVGCKIVPDTAQSQVMEMYQTKVWVVGGREMTSKMFSKDLAAWSRQGPNLPGLDFDMGLKLYRHFAVALDRKLLGGLMSDPFFDIGDYQAGRVKTTSHRSYAVQKGWHPTEGWKLQIQKSEDWRKMLGLS